MKRVIIVLVIIAILLAGAVVYSSSQQKPVTAPSTQATEPIKPVVVPLNADTIFNLVNQERIKANVKPLVRDARLDKSAQARADDMVARNYFSHFDPVDNHKMVNDKDNLAKYNNICYSSENIIKIGHDEDKNWHAIDWWMHSQSHREALLNPEYELTGVAVNGIVGVQHFCNLK